MKNTPSFLGSFNARFSTPAEVAETFVPSDDYRALCEIGHTLLLGPRGSGKTTLLKMLTLPALAAWDEAGKGKILPARPPFNAIYVPSDVHWHHQIEYAKKRMPEAPEHFRQLSASAVTTSIFKSTLETIQYLVSSQCDSPSIEMDICSLILRSWQLPPTIPAFAAVTIELNLRSQKIADLINDAVRKRVTDDSSPSLPEFTTIDYLPALSTVCEAMSSRIGSPNSKWALCFDEMELMPDWLQERLMTDLRSTNQRFVFKIGTSPIPGRIGMSEATEDNDFRVLRIWLYEGKSHRPFCESLIDSILKRKFGDKATAERFLGRSDAWGDDATSRNTYSSGSDAWKVFRDLASWDDSFRDELVKHGLDPKSPLSDDAAVHDSFLRKAKPLAYFRQSLLKHDKKGLVRRSRKNPKIFSGLEAVCDLSDGIPRRIVGILNQMIMESEMDMNGEVEPLNMSRQASILSDISIRFAAFVKAIPGAVLVAKTADGKPVPLYDVIAQCGEYFSGKMLGRFTLDPPGSFVIDKNCPPGFVDLLRCAIDHGVIIHLEPSKSGLGPDLIGRRFRISYTLCPLFRLPFRTYKAVNLSTCIDRLISSSGGLAANPAGSVQRQSKTQLELGLDLDGV